MSTQASTFIKAADLETVQAAGLQTVQVAERVILLVWHEGKVHALDNRCPHMGFPLARGSVKDGLLTCHWHHARFELCSGGTFDPFADDVRTYPVELRGAEVWLDPAPQRDEVAYQLGRLQAGLEQNIRLVYAKAVISLLERGSDSAELLRVGGLFGSSQRGAGWRDGLTILTAMGRLLPYLARNDRALALFHGMLHVANNVEGQRPHYALEPLPGADPGLPRLKTWLRDFAEVRDRDGVERVLLSAVRAGYGPSEVADLLFAAVTDHVFLDNGHSIDFMNKAFELLDTVGWDHAASVLPSLVPSLTNATRMEETSSWRSPVDLPALLEPVFDALLSGRLTGDGAEQSLEADAFDDLVVTLLGEDPAASVQALAEALGQGAALTELSLALSYAAATRVARFHTSNEFADWISVLHTFTSANATHALLKRAPSPEGARGIWHTALHLYLNRFLNTPAAKAPSDSAVESLATAAALLLEQLLELTDGRSRVEEAAAVVYRYLQQGHDDAALLATLAKTLLREDGEFHSYQMLEAGLSLYEELKLRRPDLAPTVLVATARYLAGHAPTDRATTQTYRIAERLQAGAAITADV